MRKLAVVIFTAVLILTLPAAEAAEKGNLMMIFDASGSMWGQIDGKAKITIAKEAMAQIVEELPEDINIGLVAYGHRRKGDCDDVETLIPLGPPDKPKLLARVRGLSPKGKTPMVRSIRQTAEAIRQLEDETTILLVSDGEETCDPEPCNFVGELKKQGIKFVLHVVGFDVGGTTEEQLKCMARAGGGEYFPAKDAGKLTEALTTVIEKTVEKNLKVSIFLNGKPIGGTVEVKNPETGEQAGSRSSSEPLPLMLNVAPGTYTVTVFDEWHQEGRPSLVFENVEVNDTEVREVTAEFGSGTLTVWNLRNGNPFKGSVHVTTMDGETVGGGYSTTYPDKPATYLLQPGQYKVFAEDSWGTGNKIELGVVEISSGQTIEKKAAFDTGTLTVWNLRNGKPFKGSIRLTTMGGETVGGGYSTTYPDKPATYILLPGQYKLFAIDSWGSDITKDLGIVEISSGQTLEKKAVFDTGKLIVWPHKGGQPFQARVIVTDKNGQTMGGGWETTYPDQPATYVLEPGSYTLSAEDSWGDPVVKLDFGTVEVTAGQTLEKICDFDAPPAALDSGGNSSQDSPQAQAPQPTEEISATATVPEKEAIETTGQATPAANSRTETETMSPQDIQKMADQMKADAISKMQEAMSQFQQNDPAGQTKE